MQKGKALRLEQLILKELTSNEDYVRKVLPFLEPEYFHEASEKRLFEKINEYINKYNEPPSLNALYIDIDGDKTVDETQFSSIVDVLNGFESVEKKDIPWLIDQTEKFCQEKAIYNAIMASIAIIDGEDTKRDKGAIPDILSNALSTGFDHNVGHDWEDDGVSRYDYYNRKLNHIPFDIEIMNKITEGGLTDKTLTVFLAGTSGGKSLVMCHMASNNLMQGKNVLYITLEMAEEKVAKRIDANVLDIPIGALGNTDKDKFIDRLEKVSKKSIGKLILKEYPTATAGANHFRHLLNELNLKKGFIPDIIYIDYMNLCTSSRFRGSSNVNSYEYVKSISEELRGLSIERNLPIVTATQTNRDGYGSTDVTLENISESFGTAMTADLVIAIINNDEFKEEGKLLFKQLKHRDGDTTYFNKFFVGVDYQKMRLFDMDTDEEEDTGPVMDNTEFGESSKKGKFDFDGFR